jgi:sugar-specific transcriptional regulator TrmB
MNYAIQSFLENLDLTKNEIKIYLAALQHDGQSVSTIAHRAGVHRVAAYPIIESLVEKGLLTLVDTKRKKSVHAVDPKNISKVLAEKQRELRKLERKFENVLPLLRMLHTRDPFQPNVSVFYGVDGIRNIQEDILNTMEPGETVYSIVNLDQLLRIFPEYYTEGEYRFRREQKGFRNKAIILDTPAGRAVEHTDPDAELTEIRFVDSKTFPITINMTIYKQKVSMTSLSEPLIGIIIESPEIAKNLQLIHQLAWIGTAYAKSTIQN